MTDLFPWQRPQWRQLLSQQNQGRLPHALLLSGPAGLGKLVFAQQFAHVLLCKAPGERACGQCSGCRLIQANNHPDLLSIYPEETGKNIKVDQIRELILTLSQTAQRTGYQVAIIAPAEALNKAAANALLKTLEEPSGKVVLLLVSHQSGVLPATVLSRCQRIKFTGSLDANTWLAAQLRTLNISADADLLLKIAEYAPLRALELAQNDYLILRDQLLQHLVALTQKKVSLLAPVDVFLKQDLPSWVDAFISLALDMVRLHLGVQAQSLINQDRLLLLRQLTPVYSLSALQPLLTQLNRARQSLLNAQIHLNAQLLVESLLICWDMGKNPS